MTVAQLSAASKILYHRMRHIPGVIGIGPDEFMRPIIWAYVSTQEVADQFPDFIDDAIVIVNTMRPQEI